MKNFKVDWVNHLVGFLSTLFGIFIAFELGDLQDERNQMKKVKIALNSIRMEIENNRDIYQRNISRLSEWIEYKNFVINHSNEKGELITNEAGINQIRKKNPTRLADLKFSRRLNDSLNIYNNGSIIIDVAPETGISSNNWDAAKSSGVLNYLDFKKMAQLTQLYDWINKEMGFSETDFYANMISLNSKFSDYDKIVRDYEAMVQVYDFKLQRIEEVYNKIEWE